MAALVPFVSQSLKYQEQSGVLGLDLLCHFLAHLCLVLHCLVPEETGPNATVLAVHGVAVLALVLLSLTKNHIMDMPDTTAIGIVAMEVADMTPKRLVTTLWD